MIYNFVSRTSKPYVSEAMNLNLCHSLLTIALKIFSGSHDIIITINNIIIIILWNGLASSSWDPELSGFG